MSAPNLMQSIQQLLRNFMQIQKIQLDSGLKERPGDHQSVDGSSSEDHEGSERQLLRDFSSDQSIELFFAMP